MPQKLVLFKHINGLAAGRPLGLTDEKLYELCKKYGAAARLWRQKFTGLLPEVNRRHLYEKKGFSSIFEFAAKLCGLSAEQVRLALNLEKRFEDKPALKQMLVNGEASINKLSRIVSIATPQNEEELAAKIKLLPKSALDTLVRDEKYLQMHEGLRKADSNSQIQVGVSEDANGLQKPSLQVKGLPGQTFQLADDVTEELNNLHSKGIDVNELLREMLKQRREKIAQEKAAVTKIIQAAGPSRIAQEKISEGKEKIVEKLHAKQNATSASRYIPAKIKKILQKEYGEKCSINTCRKPAQIIHHTQRFSLSQNHDPRFLAPLCREHHAIAHSIDFKYHEARLNLSTAPCRIHDV